jgi:membrane protein
MIKTPLSAQLDRITRNKWICFSCAGLLSFMCAVALYSFITTPFTGDIKVFFAAANQVKYQDSKGLLAVFESWELKGIGNRVLIYLIYLIADNFVGFENTLAFECAANAVYSAFILLILFFSVYLLPVSRKSQYSVFFAVFLAFFTVNSLIQMQAEMTCVALSFCSIACILHGKKWSLVLSGLIGACLFFFKSVFILLFISVVLGVVLFNLCVTQCNSKKQILLALISMLAFELIFVVATLLIYPQEFKDMGYAAKYQSTLLTGGSSVPLDDIKSRFVSGFVDSVVMVPFLLAGVIAAIVVFIRLLKGRQWSAAVCLAAIWIISFDILVVSNTYFPYHYFLLMLPGVLSILLFWRESRQSSVFVLLSSAGAFVVTVGCWLLKDGLRQTELINDSTVLLVCLHLILFAALLYGTVKFRLAQKSFLALTLMVCLFFWMNYASVIAPYYRNIRAIEKQTVRMNQTIFPEDMGAEPVLFLDAGYTAFYTDAPSYSRYFFNLPLQRSQKEDRWECQEEQYELLMKYSGKYVVYSDWLGLNKYPELKAKLENEYTPLENGELYGYSPSWDVFTLNPVPTGDAGDDYIHILVRKP